MLQTHMSEQSSEKKSSESISDRRFRRYNHRKMQQNKAAREDAVFYRAVFSIAGIGAALAIGLAVFAMNGGGDLSGRPGPGPLARRFRRCGAGWCRGDLRHRTFDHVHWRRSDQLQPPGHQR